MYRKVRGSLSVPQMTKVLDYLMITSRARRLYLYWWVRGLEKLAFDRAEDKWVASLRANLDWGWENQLRIDKVRLFLKNLQTGYDCDIDSHTHQGGNGCRCCDAARLLEELEKPTEALPAEPPKE